MKKEKMNVFKGTKKKNFHFSFLKKASLIALNIKWTILNIDKNKQSV